MKKDYWRPGEKAEFSRIAGIDNAIVSKVLHRLIGVTKFKAFRFEAAAKAMGKDIPFIDWLFNATTKHPAFYGERNKYELGLINQAKKLTKK